MSWMKLMHTGYSARIEVDMGPSPESFSLYTAEVCKWEAQMCHEVAILDLIHHNGSKHECLCIW